MKFSCQSTVDPYNPRIHKAVSKEGLRGWIPVHWKDSIMLVLGRKPGEKILIGKDVVVTVVRIGPNMVRLGIDAPREMNIVREELVQSARVGHPEAGETGSHIDIQL